MAITLVTLLDAGEYITALPKKEHAAADWQAAMEARILVAEGGGSTLFARIGIMRALNAGKPAPPFRATAEAGEGLSAGAVKNATRKSSWWTST
ncbi:hypothetical protein [Bradyrhizobium sp. RT10b]|uniref:hypothetical protein n=1 Tax=Bradyrhizobium sp. RT10b TaxID=3156331 RepID=UPI003394CA83